MYVLNSEILSEDKVYFCNGIIGEYLIFQKHLSLFCRKGRMYGFAKTKELEEAIKDLPFYLKITKIF